MCDSGIPPQLLRHVTPTKHTSTEQTENKPKQPTARQNIIISIFFASNRYKFSSYGFYNFAPLETHKLLEVHFYNFSLKKNTKDAGYFHQSRTARHNISRKFTFISAISEWATNGYISKEDWKRENTKLLLNFTASCRRSCLVLVFLFLFEQLFFN